MKSIIRILLPILFSTPALANVSTEVAVSSGGELPAIYDLKKCVSSGKTFDECVELFKWKQLGMIDECVVLEGGDKDVCEQQVSSALRPGFSETVRRLRACALMGIPQEKCLESYGLEPVL